MLALEKKWLVGRIGNKDLREIAGVLYYKVERPDEH
jgi:hypothetical protein